MTNAEQGQSSSRFKRAFRWVVAMLKLPLLTIALFLASAIAGAFVEVGSKSSTAAVLTSYGLFFGSVALLAFRGLGRDVKDLPKLGGVDAVTTLILAYTVCTHVAEFYRDASPDHGEHDLGRIELSILAGMVVLTPLAVRWVRSFQVPAVSGELNRVQKAIQGFVEQLGPAGLLAVMSIVVEMAAQLVVQRLNPWLTTLCVIVGAGTCVGAMRRIDARREAATPPVERVHDCPGCQCAAVLAVEVL